MVRDLVRKSKANELRVAELSGSTFSLTNLSSYDIENFTPLINPPEVGILGVGRVIQQPTVTKSGDIEVRSIGYFSLTFDHRAWDGAPGRRILASSGEEPVGTRMDGGGIVGNPELCGNNWDAT